MLNENAQKWVETLRSGVYEQGQHQLRYEDFYCCLGVACEVYRKEVGGVWEQAQIALFSDADADGGTWWFGSDPENKQADVLPTMVAEWLGLKDEKGSYGEESLTFLNDEGASFDEIADVIEKEPEGLFAT